MTTSEHHSPDALSFDLPPPRGVVGSDPAGVPREEVARMKKDPEKAKAPIDWAKWLTAAGSVVRAIVLMIRSLDRD